MAFGSNIYPCRDELPKFTSDDLKRRAVDPNAWYEKFAATGIPPRDTPSNAPPQCEPTPSDVFRDVGGEDQEPRGQLGKIALSILMRILYAARLARFDLLRITCKLATRVSRWTAADDARLLRLIQYIYHHASDRQTGFIGDDESELSLHLFCDADFAGDSMIQRSTSGAHLAIHGEHSIFPLQGLSAKQSAVAFSTPEAEFYAGCEGYMKVMIQP